MHQSQLIIAHHLHVLMQLQEVSMRTSSSCTGQRWFSKGRASSHVVRNRAACLVTAILLAVVLPASTLAPVAARRDTSQRAEIRSVDGPDKRRISVPGELLACRSWPCALARCIRTSHRPPCMVWWWPPAPCLHVFQCSVFRANKCSVTSITACM